MREERLVDQGALDIIRAAPPLITKTPRAQLDGERRVAGDEHHHEGRENPGSRLAGTKIIEAPHHFKRENA